MKNLSMMPLNLMPMYHAFASYENFCSVCVRTNCVSV